MPTRGDADREASRHARRDEAAGVDAADPAGRMFAIRPASDGRLLLVERWGLWDVAEARSYRVALRAAIAEATRAGIGFDVVIDIGHAETMPRDATQVMAQVAADLEAGPARRIAFVGPGALKRLQVRRLAGDSRRFGTFDTRPEADAWLASA